MMYSLTFVEARVLLPFFGWIFSEGIALMFLEGLCPSTSPVGATGVRPHTPLAEKMIICRFRVSAAARPEVLDRFGKLCEPLLLLKVEP
jgi:hypothetical protein